MGATGLLCIASDSLAVANVARLAARHIGVRNSQQRNGEDRLGKRTFLGLLCCNISVHVDAYEMLHVLKQKASE